MTTARRHPGEPPRRHRGVCVVALFNAAKDTMVSRRQFTAEDHGFEPRRCACFNADRLTDSGLKPEMGPVCHTPHKGPRGLAHSAGQGSTAQPGVRRPVTPAGVTARSPALPALAGFSDSVHGSQSLACAWERLGTILPKGSA